jgi:hypothetical protein
MGGSIDDVLIISQKIPTGRAPLACRDHMLVRAVRVHDIHLVALVWRARRLEDQTLAIGRPVGFRVLAPVCQLPDIA